MPDPTHAPWADLRARLAWARAWRRAVARRHDALSAAVHREIGKSPFECFVSEIVPLLRALAWLERRAGGMLRERRLAGGGWLSPGVVVRRARAPLGRVAIIATWNYPVGLLGVQLAHALVAGNRAIVKPSERSPESQRLLLDLAADPGRAPLPAGVLESLPATRQAGADLLALAAPDAPGDRRIDHVVFTGSTAVGRRIAAALAPSLTTSTLELSGRDSALVLADADPELAARSIWSALLLNAGQTCMGPRRAIVAAPVYDAFLSALRPLADSAPVVRLADSREAAEAWACVPEALASGARPIGQTPEPPGGPAMRPVALADCMPTGAAARGDHFGPVLAVVRAESDAEAIALHRRIDQTLATSIFTRSARAATAAAAGLGSTIVTINDCVVPTGHPEVGLGGRGPSGWGVSRGREGLLAMTRPVYITRTARWPRTPTTPLEGDAARRFMRIVSALLGR